MKLSEEMREYLFRLSEHEPVTRPEAGWPDAVAELEAENAELREYIASVGHKATCVQYAGPYDLGELEPACECGHDGLLAKTTMFSYIANKFGD